MEEFVKIRLFPGMQDWLMVTDHGVPDYMPGKITLVLEGWAGVYLQWYFIFSSANHDIFVKTVPDQGSYLSCGGSLGNMVIHCIAWAVGYRVKMAWQYYYLD